MSQSPETFEAKPRVIEDTGPTLTKDGMSQTPVFITEQEVMFGTAAARPPRRASILRRLIDAIRLAVGAFHLPPARQHYPQSSLYLEGARMAREMERL
jgi:hypothetical protein